MSFSLFKQIIFFFLMNDFFLVNKMSENSEKLAALLFDREKEQIFGTNAKISGT